MCLAWRELSVRCLTLNSALQMSLDRALPMSPPGQLSSYLPLHSGHRLCLRSHMRNFEIGPTARWSTLDPIYIKLFFKVLAIPFIWYQVCEDPLSLIFFCENLSKYPGEKWTRDSVRPM